jgi:hypothetical protein
MGLCAPVNNRTPLRQTGKLARRLGNAGKNCSTVYRV